MNMQIPESLRDEKRDKKLKDFASQKAYEAAANHVAAEVQAAPTTAKRLEGALARIDTLESRPSRAEVTLLPPAAPKPEQKQVNGLRLFGAAVLAEMKRRDVKGGIDVIDEVIGKAFPGDRHERARRAAKSMTSIGNTTSPGNAAELASNASRSIYLAMQQSSVFASLLQYASVLDFEGNGSLTFPARSGTGDLEPSWIEESASLPVKQGLVEAATANRFKMGVITVVSEELIRSAAVSNLLDLIERFIRDDFSRGMDRHAFDPSINGVAGVRPPSIMHGAPTSVSAGSTFENKLADLGALRKAMVGARRPVLMMNTDNRIGLDMTVTADGYPHFRGMLAEGNLYGIPVLHSPYFSTDEVHALDADAVLIGRDPMTVDTSDTATLVMLNSDGVDPTMTSTWGDEAVDVEGSVRVSDAATVVGGPADVKSMMQHYSVAMRAVAPVGWVNMVDAKRHVLTGVAW